MAGGIVWRAAMASAAAIVLWQPSGANAQTATANNGALIYPAEEFSRFNPRTALDMLRQVPGFVIKEQAEERGLGVASGNVLLNGQRFSGKSDDILSQLDRIPAKNVEKIEILDGATLGIPGLSGQVANIVTRSSGISGQYMWRPEFRAHFTRPLLSRFSVSASGRKGPVDFNIGIENQSSHSGAGGPSYVYSPAGDLVEFRDEIWTGEFDQPKGSARLAIDGPGSSKGNLNLSYRKFWYDYVEDGTRVGPGLPDRIRDVDIKENGWEYEVGGDVEFKFGPGRLKLIALDRLLKTKPDSLVLTEFVDGSPMQGDRFFRNIEEGERIFRSEYSWKTGKSDWQVTGEGAFNSLDVGAHLFTILPDGSAPEVPFPGSSARVEEDRYEVIGSWSRPLSDTFSIKLAAGGEYSKLSQFGGGGTVRSFYRPKGQFTAAWKAAPNLDVNFRAQRKVGQLDFYDFLASVDLDDDLSTDSNPDLVPPQSWELEVETARNLGAWGSATLRVYGHFINDIVDIIPVGATGEAVGNLDSAKRYGAELKGTIKFDPIGFDGAKLDMVFQLQQSRVTDPLTGEQREISDSLRELVDVDFRHDVPGTDWAWGFGIFHDKYAPVVRLTEEGRLYEGPVWQSVFVENKDVFGLTLRATAGNLASARSRWDRVLYVDRRDGPVSTILDRDRLIGPIFTFQLSGKF